jgi:bifunctional DNA-binding transcriptional regulator/antitoxin component of YhaV-PrlF toxin-antitoxin module
LVIPNEYRESLDLKQGDNLLLSLDSKTNTITISPIYGKQNDLVKMKIEFGDTPGCLAKIASKLAEMKIDLVMTESKSFERGTKARWDIIADISKTKLTLSEIKKSVLNTKFVKSMSINKIARDRLFH